MMNFIETINENFKKVYEIRHTAAKVMRELYILPYQEKRNAINANRDLSEEGKQRQLLELTKKLEEEVLKAASDMQRMKDEALEKARKAAQQVLVQPLEKVDDVTSELFNEKLREVQAAVIFSTNSMTALEALTNLLDTEEPVLAKAAAEKVLQLSNHVLVNTTIDERQQVKMQLGRIHNDLYERGLPQGAREAKEALETIDSMRKTHLMPQVVVEALGRTSSTLKEYSNRPQDYIKS